MLIWAIFAVSTSVSWGDAPAPEKASSPSVVRVVQTDEGWQLLRNGEPYVIRGGGGQSHLDALVESGGNSFRLWGTQDAQHYLDQAHARGLTVTVGFWMQHAYRGFDYTDDAARAEQLERLRRDVEKYKDHPALLIWGIGNEVELRSQDLDLILGAIEEAAALVKSIDPNHPTMAVLAGVGRDKAKRVAELCPSIDILGVNTYAGLRALPAQLTRQGYDGPYIVTEFGPPGHWESPKTDWGAAIELTSSQKAEVYASNYELGVVREMPGRALGSYAFRWGHKQERTSTWYGMFLASGERLGAADAMQTAWTGHPPDEFAPSVSGITGIEAGTTLTPDARLEVTVQSTDADGDPLEATWELRHESTDLRTGGQPESEPPIAHGAIAERDGLRATIVTPREPGHYRLFVVVRDGTGRAGTANVPFAVTGDSTPP
ncbi:MAG: glycoside hydrolase family 2 TIM barrel-domain containing protein [Planctomycetota bacterium]